MFCSFATCFVACGVGVTLTALTVLIPYFTTEVTSLDRHGLTYPMGFDFEVIPRIWKPHCFCMLPEHQKANLLKAIRTGVEQLGKESWIRCDVRVIELIVNEML